MDIFDAGVIRLVLAPSLHTCTIFCEVTTRFTPRGLAFLVRSAVTNSLPVMSKVQGRDRSRS